MQKQTSKTGQVAQIEKSPQDTGRLYRAIFDCALDAILIADDQNNYVDANPAACELFGLSKEELLSRRLSDFVEPGQERAAEQAWKEFLEQGKQKGVFRIRRPDGQVRVLEYSAKANLLPGRHASVLRDITGRVGLEEELREQAEVIETVNRVGLMLSAELDLKRLLQALTDAATELTGARFGAFFYNVIDARGPSYMLYTLSGVPIEHFANFPMPRATDLFGPTFKGEGIIRSHDIKQDPRYGKNSPYFGIPPGHLPVTSYLAIPVVSRSGEVLGGLFFGHPEAGVFTEREEQMVEGLAAQAAIAIDNARLYQDAQEAIREREVALSLRDEMLAREQAARAEAEAANRAKDEFLATISHELRTPLNAILGWGRMLRSGKLDDETFAHAIQTIERNARSQAKIIEDILDVSRIVTGKLPLNLKLLDVAPIVEAAIDSVRPAADAKMIEITKSFDDAPAVVSGDPDRLQQIVWNLLSNAVKFTPNGGRVDVRLERHDAEARVIVSDTGKGISREFIPFVFDRFRQADSSTTRVFGGLGLGLAIVRHIAEMHGGTVRAESAGEGQGATFVVMLPLCRSQAADPAARGEGSIDNPSGEQRGKSPAPGPRSEALSGLRALLVEDEADAREMFSFILRRNGAEVRACANARDALRLLREWSPDVLVADIGMPGEDGYDMIREIRQLEPEEGGAIPALALTAYARPEDRQRALDEGFQMHVAKPVEPAEVVALVAQLAGRARP